MPNHQKPTQEELDAAAAKALEEAESMEKKPEPSEEAPEPTPSKEVEEPTPSEEIQEPTPSKEIKEDVDYKKKFTESSREALVLRAKEQKMNEALEIAKNLPEPTEEEMVKEFPEWDVMSDAEKKMAKRQVKSDRRFAALEEVTKESKDIVGWNNKVDQFVEDPKNLITYPQLEGKIEEFKQYATKPTHRAIPFEVLVSAFLGDASRQIKPKNKGSQLEQGNGGPKDKGKVNDKVSFEQSETIRKTDYKRWTELLRAGKIDDSI